MSGRVRYSQWRMFDKSLIFLGAEGGTRTPTPLRAHDPESCASANSATSARGKDFILRTATLKSRGPSGLGRT
jgi:hypothetical protein